MYLAIALILVQLASPAEAAAGELAPSVESPDARRDIGGANDVLVRVQGDARVREGERVGLVVVVDGDARVEGTVDALAVIRGDAILDGARVGEMLVIQGRAELGPQSVVGGDLRVRDAEVVTAPDAVILGEVTRAEPPWEHPGLTIFGALFAAGSALALILAGVLAAALAPRGLRRAGDALTGEIGKTLLATLVVWIAIPILAAFAMITVLAMPVGLAILGVAIPVLAFIGYLVVGVRLGDAVLEAARQRSELRPFGAAVLGLALLMVLALVPYLGPVVNGLAVIVGAGALGLTLWRHTRTTAAAP